MPPSRALGETPVADSAPAPVDVWIDCDPAIGMPGRDVDDGVALIQAFHSPELRVRGVSVVFGNSPLDRGLPIAREIVGRFGGPGLGVAEGAASATASTPTAASTAETLAETPAVAAMAAALRERPLSILMLGPATNVGALLRLHPELAARVRAVVAVAGRRPGLKFVNTPRQPLPHRDFNFELDPGAMRAVLHSGVRLVLAPWEVSSRVWITEADLNALAADADGSGEFLAAKCRPWLAMWRNVMGADGFNPFDALAVGWLTHPDSIHGFEAGVWIEEADDDRAPADPRAKKPYLFADPARVGGARAFYLDLPDAGFHDDLMRRLTSGAYAQIPQTPEAP